MEPQDSTPRRLVQVTDVDGSGRRRTLLVTADPAVVSATERAIRNRVKERLSPPEEAEGDGAER